jgi:hypothetical protein
VKKVGGKKRSQDVTKAKMTTQSLLAPLTEVQKKILERDRRSKNDRRQLEIYNAVLHTSGKLLMSLSVETSDDPIYNMSKIGLWASDVRRLFGISLDDTLAHPPSSSIIAAMFPGLNQKELQSLRNYVVSTKQVEDEFEKVAQATKVDEIDFNENDTAADPE